MSAKSLNKVMLIGNVTRDPELRYTPQGNAVCTFGLATNRSWKTEGGEIREEAEFHRLVAWNKLAELCSQLCTKGRKIYVEGRLQTRTFTGSDNAQHTITEIVIDDMILLDSKFAHPSAGSGQEPVAPVVPAAEPVVEEPASAEAPAGEEKPAKKGKAKKEEKEEAKEPDSAKATPAEDVNLDDIPF
ncbi:single-stranded DNA-binding protein [Candidatus Microgenomates bacterium]|nr:single-stranded DNA-binding protein [Candidatus Microgenomates bacterium]